MQNALNTPFAGLDLTKGFQGGFPTLTAELGAVARRAETSEALLQKAVDLLREATAAKTIALYLSNTSSVALLGTEGNEVRFVREAVLFHSQGSEDGRLRDREEFDGSAGLLTKRLAEPFEETKPECASEKPLVIPFYQAEEIRGALVFIGAELKGGTEGI